MCLKNSIYQNPRKNILYPKIFLSLFDNIKRVKVKPSILNGFINFLLLFILKGEIINVNIEKSLSFMPEYSF